MEALISTCIPLAGMVSESISGKMAASLTPPNRKRNKPAYTPGFEHITNGGSVALCGALCRRTPKPQRKPEECGWCAIAKRQGFAVSQAEKGKISSAKRRGRTGRMAMETPPSVRYNFPKNVLQLQKSGVQSALEMF